MKKILSIITMVLVLCATMFCFAGCELESNSGAEQDTKATIAAANSLQENQPTPTDLEYSLERYNLIRRAYWVNGQQEKARNLPCEITKPLAYIVLLTESGAPVGSFTVDGKVSSLNSFLTPDSECYEVGGEHTDTDIYYHGTEENDWLADVDGSYGENDNGIFFFTPDGNYYEWTGIYLYTDTLIEIENPVVTIKESK